MPLFCLKNYGKEIKENNIQYTEQIILPDTCQNHYRAYLNHIDEEYKDHIPDYDPENKINYKLNDIDIITNINNVLEDEYCIFKQIKINNFNTVSFMIATLVDNIDLKRLVSLFITYINL